MAGRKWRILACDKRVTNVTNDAMALHFAMFVVKNRQYPRSGWMEIGGRFAPLPFAGLEACGTPFAHVQTSLRRVFRNST